MQSTVKFKIYLINTFKLMYLTNPLKNGIDKKKIEMIHLTGQSINWLKRSTEWSLRLKINLFGQ